MTTAGAKVRGGQLRARRLERTLVAGRAPRRYLGHECRGEDVVCDGADQEAGQQRGGGGIVESEVIGAGEERLEALYTVGGGACACALEARGGWVGVGGGKVRWEVHPRHLHPPEHTHSVTSQRLLEGVARPHG